IFFTINSHRREGYLAPRKEESSESLRNREERVREKFLVARRVEVLKGFGETNSEQEIKSGIEMKECRLEQYQ
ncbi:hypothetical protein VIGAN_10053400, partial [Vigna angularis var. angularis]